MADSDMPEFDYIEDEDRDDPEMFRCPRCKEVWTHLDQVAMVTANTGIRLHGGGEDDDATVHATSAEPERVGRRHAIIIDGYCETCPTVFRIVFRQHKGNTIITTVEHDRYG